MHFYEKNIVDIKNILLNHLVNILTPSLFDSIKSIYTHAIDLYTKNENKLLTIEIIFKICLKDLNKLSRISLENELKRIKEFTKSSSYFDNLVKSVIKSYIVLLTYNASDKTCVLVNEKYHKNVNILNFIHECYIELGTIIFNDPRIFIQCIKNTTDILNNKFTIQEIDEISKYEFSKNVLNAIDKTIFKFLPIDKILNEYLKNDYIVEETFENELKKELEKEQNIEQISNNIEKIVTNTIQKMLPQIQNTIKDYLIEKEPLLKQNDNKEDLVVLLPSDNQLKKNKIEIIPSQQSQFILDNKQPHLIELTNNENNENNEKEIEIENNINEKEIENNINNDKEIENNEKEKEENVNNIKEKTDILLDEIMDSNIINELNQEDKNIIEKSLDINSKENDKISEIELTPEYSKSIKVKSPELNEISSLGLNKIESLKLNDTESSKLNDIESSKLNDIESSKLNKMKSPILEEKEPDIMQTGGEKKPRKVGRPKKNLELATIKQNESNTKKNINKKFKQSFKPIDDLI